eukprot:1160808-Pelagomonas_calceolata.AAC.8
MMLIPWSSTSACPTLQVIPAHAPGPKAPSIHDGQLVVQRVPPMLRSRLNEIHHEHQACLIFGSQPAARIYNNYGAKEAKSEHSPRHIWHQGLPKYHQECAHAKHPLIHPSMHAGDSGLRACSVPGEAQICLCLCVLSMHAGGQGSVPALCQGKLRFAFAFGVRALCLRAKNSELVSGGSDGTLIVWDITNGTLGRVLKTIPRNTCEPQDCLGCSTWQDPVLKAPPGID